MNNYFWPDLLLFIFGIFMVVHTLKYGLTKPRTVFVKYAFRMHTFKEGVAVALNLFILLAGVICTIPFLINLINLFS